VPAVRDGELASFLEQAGQLNGTGPFGGEGGLASGELDRWRHNMYLSAALVFALTARDRDRLSVLDWGGSLGHLSIVAAATLPGVELDYHVKELPLLCEAGRDLLPSVSFHSDERCLERRYDLVIASGSLQYAEDWPQLLRRLGSAAPALYVARVPMVFENPSFTSIQRAYVERGGAEYTGWVFNRTAFLDAAAAAGLALRREFLQGETPYVHGAPEQLESRGFLFDTGT